MSFPKYQGNHQIRGISAASGELRKLEKAALNSNEFLNKPAPTIIPPPDNPKSDGVVEIEFIVSSFNPESTNQSRVFQASVEFSLPIDDVSVLPTRLPTNSLESVTAVWSQNDEEAISFTAQVGDISSELPNNSIIEFDFSGSNFGLPGATSGGNPLTGQASFSVAVNYPT